MTYANYTRNTTNPLKRLAHGRRLEQAAGIVELPETWKILDYGCGDGGFFEQLEKHVPTRNLFGFDPNPERLREVNTPGVSTFQDTEWLLKGHRGSFDAIYCMEVCEHLDYDATFELFQNIRALASNDAVVIFGVPLETGLSGFGKNIFRWLCGHRQNATLGRALKSLFGLWIPRARSPRGWIGSHVGFDSKAFSELLKYGGFEIVRRRYLPFHWLRGIMNNEVYFVCDLVDPT